jgi:hypothetical protein
MIFFTEYDQPHESQTNKDIMEAITRKGMGGLCGPDSPEGDGDYQLHDSPRNDSSNQNENEYQARLQNMNALNAGNYDFLAKYTFFRNLAELLEFLQYKKMLVVCI